MPKAVGLKLGDRAYFQELRRGRSWVVSDLLIDRLTGARMFVIASRIEDRKGSLSGAVIATVDVADLETAPSPCTVRLGRPSPLFDHQGILVYNSREKLRLFRTGEITAGSWPRRSRAAQRNGASSPLPDGAGRARSTWPPASPFATYGWVAGAAAPWPRRWPAFTRGCGSPAA